MTETPTIQPTAVLYFRVVSRKPVDRKRAVDQQRHACERRANELGATIVGEYCDVGKPGRIDQRPALRELLADLHQMRGITYVITYNLARLSINMADYTYVSWSIEEAGARIEIAALPRDEHDAAGPISQHMRNIANRQHGVLTGEVPHEEA